ncbi:ABC-2 transporter permease [Eubacterium pyruvativorans]|uniref:ABC-2 transporter permease n=1 Tax=Eubacterium pyruvativorans TaxID=155865 RepID=UPI000B7E175F
MTLPVDRKTYVREKYLFILICTAAAWCIAAILYCIGERQTGSPSIGSASRYPPHSDCRRESAGSLGCYLWSIRIMERKEF